MQIPGWLRCWEDRCCIGGKQQDWRIRVCDLIHIFCSAGLWRLEWCYTYTYKQWFSTKEAGYMTDINGTDNINPSPGEADSPWAPAGPLAAGADVRRPHLKGWHAAIIVIAVLALLGIGGYAVVNQVFHHQEQARIQKEEEHLQESVRLPIPRSAGSLSKSALNILIPVLLLIRGLLNRIGSMIHLLRTIRWQAFLLVSLLMMMLL